VKRRIQRAASGTTPIRHAESFHMSNRFRVYEALSNPHSFLASIGAVVVYPLDFQASRLCAQENSWQSLKIPLRFFTEPEASQVSFLFRER
jgi:hypothetical protein